jgi:predicted DNA-binding antitoxin AbrB/MazE fold protein
LNSRSALRSLPAFPPIRQIKSGKTYLDFRLFLSNSERREAQTREYRYTMVMEKTIQAVYEGGVLRPLEPIPLEDRQEVTVTISDEGDIPSRPSTTRVARRMGGRRHR